MPKNELKEYLAELHTTSLKTEELAAALVVLLEDGSVPGACLQIAESIVANATTLNGGLDSANLPAGRLEA